MRRFCLVVFVLCIGLTTEANDKSWYVVVFGENFQTVTGASATADIVDGQFLDVGFVGKEIYVRSEEYYELDQFRPDTPAASGSGVAVATMSEGSMAANNTPEEPAPTSEFGPLTDTGLQYVSNEDFRGWYCAQLYVKPLGNRTYRLRCEIDMQHD